MSGRNGGKKSTSPPAGNEKKSEKKEKTEKDKDKSEKDKPEKEQPEKERRNSVLESHGYKLGKPIGNGSYATVKLAESEQHGGLVAIKVVSKFQAPSDYLKKFLPREIQVVKGLSHPNLIRFHQAIETTHRVYIIMEFAEQGSLLDIIRKETYIDEKRARAWFKQLIDAVEYCHNLGVVHRDIKCENLLMDGKFQIKLSDFGFARGSMGTKENEYILSDTFCGSYAYASPEILKGVPYRPQYSDVWSTGVVLFATVYGRLPFDDSNYNNLVKQVQKPVNFPKDPPVSPDCKALIRNILAPLRVRLKIPSIRQEAWMLVVDATDIESTESEVTSSVQKTESSNPQKVLAEASPVAAEH
ncbi:testis-specific serine/threonine-protein kinase 3-like [Lycorma delicatula]|uniref:testis-specific serine/threonine-protein kinase 3-like n=1 Tax=Lycorma delicatula TaxID=130591 RepID=UPI003F50D6EE